MAPTTTKIVAIFTIRYSFLVFVVVSVVLYLNPPFNLNLHNSFNRGHFELINWYSIFCRRYRQQQIIRSVEHHIQDSRVKQAIDASIKVLKRNKRQPAGSGPIDIAVESACENCLDNYNAQEMTLFYGLVLFFTLGLSLGFSCTFAYVMFISKNNENVSFETEKPSNIYHLPPNPEQSPLVTEFWSFLALFILAVSTISIFAYYLIGRKQ